MHIFLSRGYRECLLAAGLFFFVQKLLFRIMQQLEGAEAYRWYLFDVSIECQR